MVEALGNASKEVRPEKYQRKLRKRTPAMKIKKEYTILVVIIIALCLYLFFRQEDHTRYEMPQPPAIAAGTITKIDITGPEGAVTLEKRDDLWLLMPQAYLAEKKAVSDMLKTLEGLTLTALISESKDYLRYDLNPEKKITVKAWQADRLLRHFDIGKAAASFRHTFVKLIDDDNVYQAQDNFRSKFDQTVAGLRDKTVLSFAASDITEFRLTQDDATLAFVRQEVPLEQAATTPPDKEDKAASIKAKMVWKTADGRMGEESKIDRLLSTVADLQCEAFLDDTAAADLGTPVYTLEFKGPKTYTLNIYAKSQASDTTHPAVSSESKYPFTLAQWRTTNLMPEMKDLIASADQPNP
jgi:hypothetical protein